MDASILNVLKSRASATGIAIATIVLIACALLVWLLYYRTLQSRACSALAAPVNGKLSSVDPNEARQPLRDYYVKSAFNACSGGSYRNDYVDLCVLKALLRQGVRCVDFEIYSVDDRPVVATAVGNSYTVKETFNHIPFRSAMNTIVQHAFTSGSCPNPSDPLLVHLRIRSSRLALFSELAKIFKSHAERMLGPKYSYEYGGKNLGDVPLADLRGKIVIIVDADNDTYAKSKAFHEYVNLASNSTFMQAVRYHDVKFAPDMNELIERNKTSITMVLPDAGPNPSNPDPVVVRETGSQMLAQRMQLMDGANISANAFFDDAGSAFVLKPERLRSVPVLIAKPSPQTPAVSFATKTVVSDFYEFKI